MHEHYDYSDDVMSSSDGLLTNNMIITHAKSSTILKSLTLTLPKLISPGIGFWAWAMKARMNPMTPTNIEESRKAR